MATHSWSSTAATTQACSKPLRPMPQRCADTKSKDEKYEKSVFTENTLFFSLMFK